MSELDRLDALFHQHDLPTTPRDPNCEPASTAVERDADIEPAAKRQQTDCIGNQLNDLYLPLPVASPADMSIQRQPTKVLIPENPAKHVTDDIENFQREKTRADLNRLAPLYQIHRCLGNGSQGFVWAVCHVQTGKMSAMKVIPDVGDNLTAALHALREIKYLLQLRHQNVIRIEKVLGETQLKRIACVIIQMELMDSSLSDCIRKRKAIVTKPRGIANCMFQLLDGIRFIHSAGIVHRDLSTRNILVGEEKQVFKITDFDLARTLDSEDVLTGAVTTPNFQAPEIVLIPSQYSYPMDLWSLGCVLYNLFNHHPFVPRSRLLKHIANIIGKIGLEEQDLDFILDIEVRRKIFSIFKQPKVPWSTLCPTASKQGLTLLEGLMQFNPDRRLTAWQALHSEFLAIAKPAHYVPVSYEGAEMVDYGPRLSHEGIIDRLQQCITVEVSTTTDPGSDVLDEKSTGKVPAPIKME